MRRATMIRDLTLCAPLTSGHIKPDGSYRVSRLGIVEAEKLDQNSTKPAEAQSTAA